MSEHTRDEPHSRTHTHADGTTHDLEHRDHEDVHPHTHVDGTTHDHTDHEHEHGKRPGFLARLFGAR